MQLQNTYSAYIQATLDSLFNLDKGTQAVAQAAELIARDYGDSDAFARAKVGDVQDVITYTPPPAVQYGPYASTGRDGR